MPTAHQRIPKASVLAAPTSVYWRLTNSLNATRTISMSRSRGRAPQATNPMSQSTGSVWWKDEEAERCTSYSLRLTEREWNSRHPGSNLHTYRTIALIGRRVLQELIRIRRLMTGDRRSHREPTDDDIRVLLIYSNHLSVVGCGTTTTTRAEWETRALEDDKDHHSQVHFQAPKKNWGGGGKGRNNNSTILQNLVLLFWNLAYRDTTNVCRSVCWYFLRNFVPRILSPSRRHSASILEKERRKAREGLKEWMEMETEMEEEEEEDVRKIATPTTWNY